MVTEDISPFNKYVYAAAVLEKPSDSAGMCSALHAWLDAFQTLLFVRVYSHF